MAGQLWLDQQIDPKLWKVFLQVNGIYNNANVMKGIGHTIYTEPSDKRFASPRVFWPDKWLDEGDYVEFWAGITHGFEGDDTQTVQGIEAEPGHKTWMSIIQL